MNSQERNRLINKIIRISRARGEEPVIRTCPFTNNDVPNYLKKLARFEKASREAKPIMISYCANSRVKDNYSLESFP